LLPVVYHAASKVPSTVVLCDLSLCRPTLPKEGDQAWEINPSLAQIIKEDKLSLDCLKNFILVFTKHLLRLYLESRTRDLYDKYASMIVSKYKCLEDKQIPGLEKKGFRKFLSYHCIPCVNVHII
jgi:hypothetical protein